MIDQNEVPSQDIEKVAVNNDGVIFVKSTTNTKGLATCIFASVTKEDKKELRLRGIGAGAVCQMTKACIIAKSKLMEKGVNSSINMYFKDIHSDKSGDESITAIEYVLTFS